VKKVRRRTVSSFLERGYLPAHIEIELDNDSVPYIKKLYYNVEEKKQRLCLNYDDRDTG
jgi:hypothetical protein